MGSGAIADLMKLVRMVGEMIDYGETLVSGISSWCSCRERFPLSGCQLGMQLSGVDQKLTVYVLLIIPLCSSVSRSPSAPWGD
jgi:hypothetical protein